MNVGYNFPRTNNKQVVAKKVAKVDIPLVSAQAGPFDLCNDVCINMNSTQWCQRYLRQTNKAYNVMPPKAERHTLRSSQDTFRTMANFV